MQKDPMVSVVLPTYNRGETIRDSIESVLSQSYKNLELIVVDDGSTDQTKDLVKEISDWRIRYVKQSNHGPSAARNHGVRKSRGKYIAFQDSDDCWMSDKLTRQMKRIIENKDLDAVYSAFWFCKSGVRRKLPLDTFMTRDLEENLFYSLLKTNLVSPTTLLLKRECYDSLGGFDENLCGLEDWEFALRLASKYRVGYINQCLVEAHYSPSGVNEQWKNRVYTLLYILQEFSGQVSDSDILPVIFDCLSKVTDIAFIEQFVMQLVPQYIVRKQDYFFLLKIYRQRYLQSIIKQFLLRLMDKNTFVGFLEKNMIYQKKIAIYGAGDIGIALAKQLNTYGISVECLIDRNSVDVPGYRVLHPSEVKDQADLVISTVSEGIGKDVHLPISVEYINLFDKKNWGEMNIQRRPIVSSEITSP